MSSQFLAIFALLLFPSVTLGQAQGKCMRPLLDINSVPDGAFNSSSSYNKKFEAHRSRLSGDEEGNLAWCPKSKIGREKSEFLEISFDRLKLIRVIETRGRFAGNKGKEYVPYYYLKYQREDGPTWYEYKDMDHNKKMKGNDDIKTPAHLVLRPYMVAKRIRLLPYSDPKAVVCLRIEIYGCDYNGGVVEYMIPQGDRYTQDDISYADFTYDGERAGPDGMLLAGGLGQLTDSIVMRTRGENDPYRIEQKGFHYVGWKRRPVRSDPISLTFRFDRVRRFHKVLIHISNRRSKGICIFSKIVLKFSTSSKGSFSTNVVSHDYQKDEVLEMSRFVDVDLEQRIGQFVRMEVFFECDWILIDEIQFISTPYNGLIEPDPTVRPGPSKPKPGNGGKHPAGGLPPRVHRSTARPPYRPPDIPSVQVGLPDEPKPGEPPYPDFPGSDWSYMIAVISILVGACVLIAVTSFICIRRRRSRNKKKAAAKQQVYMSAVPVPNYKPPASVVGGIPPLQIDLRPDHPTMTVDGNVMNDASLYTSLPSDDGTLAGGGGGAGSDVTYASASGSFATPYGLMANGVSTLGTGKRMKSIDKPGPFRRLAKRVLSGNSSLGFAYTSLNPSVGAEYASASLFGTPPPPYSNSVGSPSGGPSIYSKPQIIPNPMAELLEGPYSSTSSGPYSRPPALPGPPPVPRFPSDISIQGVSGNTVYAAPRELDMCHTPHPVREVSPSRLTFLETLGGGQFGEVHLAQLRPASPLAPEELEKVDLIGERAQEAQKEEEDAQDVEDEDGDNCSLVAVKVLRPDANDAAKRDFENEVRILSRLKNANVVRLLGVCSEAETLTMLVEYMKYGDLNQFLQGFYPADTGTNGPAMHPSTNTLSYGSLIYMAMQIANGMKYLESLNIFHRDLACRNCLVGSYYTIKISDFGMCRRLYSSDYYRIEGRVVLAIRWMAWESLIMGKFSSKSDVWSFGVTLWEILSFCRQQPFARLANEEVIKNCANMYVEGQLLECLPCPASCPKEIYDLMFACWSKDEIKRPSFHEIHMFLQRKNFGYNPKEEDCSK